MVRQVKIAYSEEFLESTDDLIYILYSKNYFSFIEDAENYVDKIYDFIRENIASYPAKSTPTDFKKYSESYLLYKANSNTTWYIFFTFKSDVYYVEFITNNHTDLMESFNV